MIPFRENIQRLGLSALIAVSTFLPGTAHAGTTLPDQPLFVGGGIPPLMMLVLSRNHKLYFEAYNDASDLDGDGELDLNYKPEEIDYFGYFDSFKCYAYDSGKDEFEPSQTTSDKQCSGEWSGDFLNYLTMSRMDAVRKVLYGGKRVVDDTGETVLRRAYIPQDAHSWGKSYTSEDVDGYDLTEYAPMSKPSAGTRHLFASTNPGDSDDSDTVEEPLLRVLTNRTERIWEWVAKESPVADESLGTPTDYVVEVEVCTSGMLEDNCEGYTDSDGNTTYKPTGLLHDFGADDAMRFGLMTGSYDKNYSGGVLRRAIGSFQQEFNADDGTYDSSVNGIVSTIDSLRTIDFTGDTHDCGFSNEGSEPPEGSCKMWGNPVAEMMYETLRYFAGEPSPTSGFDPGSDSSGASTLDLPRVATWDDPYDESTGAPECARSFQLVLSDTNPNRDSDQLPGVDSNFSTGFSGTSEFNSETLDVASEADTIWDKESEASTVFIGQAGSEADNAPTPKTPSGFGEMRGLAPEEPNKEGSYYSGSVAYFANRNDINDRDGTQNLQTFSVALSSPSPRIEIPIGDDVVRFVPFAKRVGEIGNIQTDPNSFQDTLPVVDFFVQEIVNTNSSNIDSTVNGGRPKLIFRLNYEDAQAGADYDQDAIARYEIAVQKDDSVDVGIAIEAESTGDYMHIGYVASGTTQDGVYLDVVNQTNNDPDYFLDTPPGALPGQSWNDDKPLPKDTTSSPRNFVPGASAAEFVRHDPLWYAAKYGGFIDQNESGDPDLASEWDDDGDGDPDNYFFVANAGELGDQLTKAFEGILGVVGAASSVAVNTTKLDSSTVTYQATFNSENWEGDLRAFEFLNDGSGKLASTPIWSAEEELPASTARNLYTTVDTSTSDNESVPFKWSGLTAAEKTALQSKGVSQAVLEYIRGSDNDEQSNGGSFRNRGALIGDIIDSSPEFVGQQNFGYAALDDPETTGDEGDKYRDYLDDKKQRERVVFVGANDGMLHAFNAGNYDTGSSTFDQGTGEEIFGYIPEAVHDKLPELTSPDYEHEYYVNGSLFASDAYVDVGNSGTTKWHTVLTGAFAHGAKGIFALDVAESGSSALTIDGASGEESPMWEFTPENAAAAYADEIGHVLGQPQVVRLNDGTYAAVFGNGYNSANGNATLFVVDLETGEPITDGVIETGTGGGLSTPFIVDEDGDRNADYAYAGDLEGNMWRFNLDTSSGGDFGIAYGNNKNPEPLFRAVDPDVKKENGTIVGQPITSQPVVGVPPDGRDGVMVYFGTGKYFAVGDSTIPSDPQIQSVYGVHDAGGNKASDAARQTDGTVDGLVEQTIEQQVEASVDGEDLNLRQISDNAVDYSDSTVEGWHLDLAYNGNAVGEQVVSSPVLRFGRLSLTTFTPSDNPCEFGGRSWFMQVDAQSGSRLDGSSIDVNNDGVIDEDDLIDLDGDGNSDSVSGRQLGGVIAQPVVINDSGQDRAIFSKLCNDQNCDKTETELTRGGGLSVGRQSWREIQW